MRVQRSPASKDFISRHDGILKKYVGSNSSVRVQVLTRVTLKFITVITTSNLSYVLLLFISSIVLIRLVFLLLQLHIIRYLRHLCTVDQISPFLQSPGATLCPRTTSRGCSPTETYHEVLDCYPVSNGSHSITKDSTFYILTGANVNCREVAVPPKADQLTSNSKFLLKLG